MTSESVWFGVPMSPLSLRDEKALRPDRANGFEDARRVPALHAKASRAVISMIAPNAAASRSCGTDMNVNCGSSSGCVTIKRVIPRLRASSRIMSVSSGVTCPVASVSPCSATKCDDLENLGQQRAVARDADGGPLLLVVT